MYQLTQYGSIVRLEDGACIPTDEKNADYQKYLVWLAEGNTPNPIPLADFKATKHAQIERERDAECYADVVALGVPWQADARSQQMLASAILLAQAGVYTPSVWRNSNNADIPVTLADLVVLAGTMAAQTQAAYTRSWTRKAALAAATTSEEVEAV